MSVNRRSLAHLRLRGRAQACARFRSGVRGWARASERSLPRSAAGSRQGVLRASTFCGEHAATFRSRQRGHIGPKVPPAGPLGHDLRGRARSGSPAREPAGDGSGTTLAYPALPASAPCRSRHDRRRVRPGCRWSPVVPALGSADCHLPDLWRCIHGTQVTPWGAPGRLSGEHR